MKKFIRAREFPKLPCDSSPTIWNKTSKRWFFPRRSKDSSLNSFTTGCFSFFANTIETHSILLKLLKNRNNNIRAFSNPCIKFISSKERENIAQNFDNSSQSINKTHKSNYCSLNYIAISIMFHNFNKSCS